MKLLLDTHTYLWLSLEPESLPPRILAAINEPTNELFLSIASLWEMTIKHAKGKLPIPGGNMEVVLEELRQQPIQISPIEPDDLLVLQSLKSVEDSTHKDPFDRIIVAQALRHGMTLATVDGVLEKYGVPILWN